MTVVVDESRTFGGLPVVGVPVSIPSFGAREDVFVALLDTMFEAGVKAVAWEPPGLRWSVFLSDEEVQGLRSWDLRATDGLDLDAIRRQYGEDSDLAVAVNSFEAALDGHLFDVVLGAAFGTESRVVATPAGFDVEPMETDQ